VIGRTISHYAILEKLGEGGMGVVYKALDTKLDRHVALKFLPAHLVDSPEDVARFEQEAKAISGLNHPGIATIHDVDESEGKKFLVLEYIAGGTLKARVKKLRSEEKELSIAEVIDYGMQMAEGLSHAHRHRIVHRDIKSDNVMLTEEGKLKITDFGLAKLRGRVHLTKTGSTVGTLAYMAPEQLRGEEIDTRADLFSLGVVLYELVTLRLPFRGEHEAALTYSIAHEEPVSIRSLRRNVPPALEQLIMRCLVKDRTLRFQNAADIAADLRALQLGAMAPARVVIARQRTKLLWMIGAAVLVLGGIGVYLLMPATRPTGANSKTIAVLPFLNLTEQKEDEYFSDGITDDILAQLAQIRDLKVISRTTMMQYKRTTKSMREIGRDLSAGVVLEGSVRRAGSKIRIVAQLIDAGTDDHLWAASYDKEYKEVFAIQSDVAAKIAASLAATLSPDEKKRFGKKATENPEAYDLYLKGRYAWNKRLPRDLQKGIEYFQEALAKDPGYARAYAGLADSYTILGDFNILPPQETYSKAKDAAMKALENDAELPEAHTSLAYAMMHYDRDWPGAEREFRRALELAPNSAQAHSWYGLYLAVMGRFDEAANASQRARALDPYSAVILTDGGLILYFARKYDAAIALLREALSIDPTFVVANIPLGGAYVQKHMDSAAIAAFEQLTMASAFVTSKANPVPIAALAYVFGVSKRREDALMYIELLREKSATEYVSPYWMAVAYAGLGNTEEELRWLEKAFEDRDGFVSFVSVEPIFDGLRADPQFLKLLRKPGIEK
jgi:serine/threonine-protein kinase